MDIAKLRHDAGTILQAGLEAADPVRAIRQTVTLEGDSLSVADQVYDLTPHKNIFVVGAGKASAAMAQALEEILGERIRTGRINVKYDHTLPLNFIQLKEAGHPVPDEAGYQGTQEIIQLLRGRSENDLVFCLLSGGGSALLPSPASCLNLADKQVLTQKLLGCGATIHEINALRKHVSGIKGGKLAQLTYPATLITLILSDVVGDDLESIASGPTVPDHSTFADCLRILEKYTLLDEIPKRVADFMRCGAAGDMPETPKGDDPAFKKTQNVIVASNIQALEAARSQAEALGYNCLLLSSMVEGETKEVAKVHAAVAREIRASGNPLVAPACVISGGETTVKIRGQGKGGRNQEFVLAAAIEIAGMENTVVLSAGTDGTDGPTDAAGAVADGDTIARSEELGLNAESYLQDNDSYHFFEALDDLLITGPTLTNVMDLRLILLG
jgi:hydroxypyruvate reductase